MRINNVLSVSDDGRGRLATDQDKLFMKLNGIPRAKITSINTGIPNMIACFLI